LFLYFLFSYEVNMDHSIFSKILFVGGILAIAPLESYASGVEKEDEEKVFADAVARLRLDAHGRPPGHPHYNNPAAPEDLPEPYDQYGREYGHRHYGNPNPPLDRQGRNLDNPFYGQPLQPGAERQYEKDMVDDMVEEAWAQIEEEGEFEPEEGE
jgi:hypothetical protein